MDRRQVVGLFGLAAAGSLRAQVQSTATAVSSVRQEWLDRRTEPILEPDLPIVDPHHHLWERPNWHYFLPELLADVNSGHNVLATVFVQARAMYRNDGPVEMRPVGETEFVNGIAAQSASGLYGKTRVAAGIVGHADMTLGARVAPVLEAQLRAASGRFRGIRHITAWDADSSVVNPNYPSTRTMMAEKPFREAFAVLGRYGLSFDAWIYHPQIDDLAELADAFPDTNIVLNHVGGPLGSGVYAGKRDEVFARWRKSIKTLAARRNVCVKLGGLGQDVNGLGLSQRLEAPDLTIVAAAIRPYVETCIEAFGTQRCMFESNFPVDKVSYSYAVFWNAAKLLARSASDDEKADLFSRTAARFYRLDLPA